MKRAPTITINKIKVYYIQVPYVTRCYKLVLQNQVLFFEHLELKSFFGMNTPTFKERVKLRDMYLDQ
jgi:hypothetical protein